MSDQITQKVSLKVYIFWSGKPGIRFRTRQDFHHQEYLIAGTYLYKVMFSVCNRVNLPYANQKGTLRAIFFGLSVCIQKQGFATLQNPISCRYPR